MKPSGSVVLIMQIFWQKFNFLNVIHCFLTSFWKLASLMDFVQFTYVDRFISIKLFIISWNFPFNICKACSVVPLWFLILFYVYSLFFPQVSLVKVYQFYVFLTNQLYLSWYFLLYFCSLFHQFFSLIMIMSIMLFILGLTFSCHSFWKWKLWSFIWGLS